MIAGTGWLRSAISGVIEGGEEGGVGAIGCANPNGLEGKWKLMDM